MLLPSQCFTKKICQVQLIVALAAPRQLSFSQILVKNLDAHFCSNESTCSYVQREGWTWQGLLGDVICELA